MKKIFSLLLAASAFACTQEKVVEITISNPSTTDKLSCADKHPANSNMYVISLYFFMNLISTFHLQKYINKAGRDLWFL